MKVVVLDYWLLGILLCTEIYTWWAYYKLKKETKEYIANLEEKTYQRVHAEYEIDKYISTTHFKIDHCKSTRYPHLWITKD